MIFEWLFLASTMSGNSGIYYCLISKSVADFFFGRTYNVVFGLFQAPFYAIAQTMMAELIPPRYENMVSYTTIYIYIYIYIRVLLKRLNSSLGFSGYPPSHRP
jgi:hypothetical protein